MSELSALRVNVGCAHVPLPGYVNLDLEVYPECEAPEVAFQLCDVRQGLPFEDATVHEVRGDQFLEHLTLQELPAFLRECWRVLVPGGEVRFVFPDIIGIGTEAAVGSIDHAFPDVMEADVLPKGLVVLNLVARGGWGHEMTLTTDLVVQVLERLGFRLWWHGSGGPNGMVIGVKPEA